MPERAFRRYHGRKFIRAFEGVTVASSDDIPRIERRGQNTNQHKNLWKKKRREKNIEEDVKHAGGSKHAAVHICKARTGSWEGCVTGRH